MTKIKNAWSKFIGWDYSFLALTFIIPCLLMWLIYISLRVFPFGNNSVLVLDLNGQYVYFFEALRDKIMNGGSLLYSWGRAMGGEFMGIFAYYLSSPFSLIVCLFPKNMITEALLTIILLKVGLCGGTMGFYLHKTHPSSKVKVTVFSVLYALSAYVVVYVHNIMWIDALIWLPIITFALEELIKKGNFRLFVVSLAMSLMANFYIGYMICIYVVIYFVYYYIAKSENGENNFWCESNHFIKSFGRFAIYSLLAAALAAWIILPTYYSLQFGKSTFSSPNYDLSSNFDFLALFSKFLYSSYDTVRPEGLPQLYCGILTLLLAPLYFFSKKVKAREKMAGVVLISIFILSFSASTIDIFWHGMQRPNWLNYRYSFMLIFILLVFSYKALDSLAETDFKTVAAVFCGVGILIIMVQAMDYSNVDDMATVWASFGFLIVYLLVLYAIKKGFLENGAVLILCVIVCVEAFTAGLINAVDLDEDVVMSTRTSYREYIDKYESVINDITSTDTSFYRMEIANHRKTNDSFALGYNGLSGSTSTLNASQVKLMNQLGYSSKSHWSKYLGGTPVSDSLLGLKYVVSDEANLSSLYEICDSYKDSGIYTYINPYALSVAFATNDSIRNINFASFDSPFELMNTIISAMLNEDVEVFKQIEVTDTSMSNLERSYISGHEKYSKIDTNSNGTLTYTLANPENAGTLYMFLDSEYPREVGLNVGGKTYENYFANESDRIMELDDYSSDEVQVTLTLSDEECIYITSKDTDFWFAYIDEEVFEDVMTRLAENQLNITEHSDTRLYGNIEAGQNNTTLFTSIVYDDMWQIFIDGERVETFKTGDSLLACHISCGEHTVEIKYVSKPFNIGLTISICAALLFSGACVCRYYGKKREKKRWVEEGY